MLLLLVLFCALLTCFDVQPTHVPHSFAALGIFTLRLVKDVHARVEGRLAWSAPSRTEGVNLLYLRMHVCTWARLRL